MRWNHHYTSHYHMLCYFVIKRKPTSCREWTGRVATPTMYIPPVASSWILMWDFLIWIIKITMISTNFKSSLSKNLKQIKNWVDIMWLDLPPHSHTKIPQLTLDSGSLVVSNKSRISSLYNYKITFQIVFTMHIIYCIKITS